jgi:hypothetical protein
MFEFSLSLLSRFLKCLGTSLQIPPCLSSCFLLTTNKLSDFFSDALHAKLAGSLRPWLTSQFKAANLSLDPSCLNSTLDDSSTFNFEELMLREVELRVFPWSIPSVDVSIRSLNVAFTLILMAHSFY